MDITPQYHTIAKSSTIASLKKQGIMRDDIELEEALLKYFMTIRTSVLERYLKWRLSITTEEFEKYCRNYLPLRHKPMSDIKEALDLAQEEIKFDIKAIRRNGFLIAANPVNTKLILENVLTLVIHKKKMMNRINKIEKAKKQTEIEHHIDVFLKMRNQQHLDTQVDITYHNLNHKAFSDDQILSLVLYQIEKKYHFSGDGIWSRVEGNKAESLSGN
ncbi:Uncharacterized protein OBRU01_11104 [Operophtera brumata]|uniref:Uncharacterized protein n=1 Tax=Operophtera brumata TaxID=104452 RepID=A0A0L7LE10_OPEBR|nr:Uncharacterized protein OBRU01_11104 [Operophtera brumata]